MKKACPITLLCFLINLVCPMGLTAESEKTRDDFAPPPPEERPLLPLIPESLDDRLGLEMGIAGAAAGTAMALYGTYSLIEKALIDPYDPSIQGDILFSGTALVGTALSFAVFDFFLERLAED